MLTSVEEDTFVELEYVVTEKAVNDLKEQKEFIILDRLGGPKQDIAITKQGLAENLAKKNNCRVFQASTSEVYGDPLIAPQVESYWGNVNPIGIRSCYDEGKRAAETIFMDYHRNFGVDIRIARIFNTYGPLMTISDGRVVSNFIVQALNGQDITIYGDGEQTRSLCYVDDLITAMVKFFNQDQFIGPLNLGNPAPLTMNDLAKEILQLCNSQSRLIHLPLPKDDPLNREPDIQLAEKYLNWTPLIDRHDGLVQTIEYFRKTLKIK